MTGDDDEGPRMADTADKLFTADRYEAEQIHATGILPSQVIRAFCRDKVIQSMEEITEGQIQPSSLDLRLGDKAYRVRASFLPGKDTKVTDKIESLAMHEFDLAQGAV